MKLYYTRIGEWTKEELHVGMQLLPKIRIEKIQKMKSEKNRILSMTAGLLLEYALREEGMIGTELTFIKNADGKPYIKEHPEFCYNLSHSKECAALVVDRQPVGVDVEGLRIGYKKLANRFFSEVEAASLNDAWSDEEFTRIWTRKESYLKATGYGMRMPLQSFSTLQERVEINDKMPEEMRKEEPFYLASTRIEDGYWLSVCKQGTPVVSGTKSIMAEYVELKEILKKE